MVASRKREERRGESGSSAVTDSFEDRRQRALRIFNRAGTLFPKAKIALRYSNSWELLVAVILSAQCTDKKVNEVTKTLFQKYPKLEDYMTANVVEFEQDIKPAGFYHAKAKSILTDAKVVQERFGGNIPQSMKELLSLRGVARKTANVVLGNAYGIVEGIAVDTHVKRLAQKFRLSDSSNPNKIEQDLMELLPRHAWFPFTYRMIEYGRKICHARKHDCASHPLTKLYLPAANIWP